MATDNDIAAILSTLEYIRQDLAEEREAARDSRAATQLRIDELTGRVGHMDTTIAVAGQVDAQVRQELDALKKSVADLAPTIKVDALEKAISELAPTVDEWRRIRQLGLGIVGLMTAGGITVGAILAAGGNYLVDIIRHWLRLQ